MSLTDRMKKRRIICNGNTISPNPAIHIEGNKELKCTTTIKVISHDSDANDTDGMDKNASCKKIVLSSKWLLHDKNNNGIVSVENLSNDNKTITKSSCEVMNQTLLKNDDDNTILFEIKDSQNKTNNNDNDDNSNNDENDDSNIVNKCKQYVNEKSFEGCLLSSDSHVETKNNYDENSGSNRKNQEDANNDMLHRYSVSSSNTKKMYDFKIHDNKTPSSPVNINNNAGTKEETESINGNACSNIRCFECVNNSVNNMDDNTKDMNHNETNRLDNKNDDKTQCTINNNDNFHMIKTEIASHENNNRTNINEEEEDRMIMNKISNDTTIIWSLQQHQHQHPQHQIYDNDYNIDSNHQDIIESEALALLGLGQLQQQQQGNSSYIDDAMQLLILQSEEQEFKQYEEQSQNQGINKIQRNGNNAILFEEHDIVSSAISTSTTSVATKQPSRLKVPIIVRNDDKTENSNSYVKKRKKELISNSNSIATSNEHSNTNNKKKKNVNKKQQQKQKKQQQEQQHQQFKEAMRNLLFVSGDNTNTSIGRTIKTERELEFIHRAFLLGQLHQHNNVMLSENNINTNNNGNSYNNGNTILPHWFETKFDSIILNSMKQIKRKSITAHTIAIQKYLDL